MKILFMEDEPAIRLAMKRGLKRAGFDVEVASNLSEARDLASKSRPDALVSDLKLPDGSGLELAEELAIPFILMSGYAVFDDAVAALRLGCVDFFTKPVAIEDIVRCLSQLADKPSMQKSAQPLAQQVGAAATVSGAAAMVIGLAHPEQVSGEQSICLNVFTPDTQQQAEQQLRQITVQQLCWENQTQAQAAFARAAPSSLRGRKIVAELMQLTNAGQLVINQSAGHYSLWLDQILDETQQQAAIPYLQRLADVFRRTAHGIHVEYTDDL